VEMGGGSRGLPVQGLRPTRCLFGHVLRHFDAVAVESLSVRRQQEDITQEGTEVMSGGSIPQSTVEGDAQGEGDGVGFLLQPDLASSW
jgi:hypothetical protein